MSLEFFRNWLKQKEAEVIPIKPGADAPWLKWMRSHLGEHEILGTKDNPFIVALFKHTSYDGKHDEVPWCAACVSAALEETGFKSTHRADAISYAKFGVACDLKPGAILVFQWSNGEHHVAFCDRVVDSEYVAAIGGNQSNSLKVSNYARGCIIACRWPA